MKNCVILANGEAPLKSEIEFILNSGYNTLICADGGANTAFEFGLVPDFIIGDFDSVKREVLDYFYGKSGIIKVETQDDTDVEKCLKFAINNGFEKVIIIGATGDRLDHSFSNLAVCLRFSDKIQINLIYKKSILFVCRNQYSFKSTPGEPVSIYGFDNETKIKSSGLKYELLDETFPFGIRESSSNEAAGSEVNLNISGEKIILIRNYKEAVENGFFQSA